MKIMLTGPQGCGKTTQAKILANELDFCLVKTGDLIREFAKGDSPQAKEVYEKLMIEGELVDDLVVANLLKKALRDDECKKNFIIDGYPRRMSQLHTFDPGYEKVFFINISDEEAIRRLLKRGRADDKEMLILERLEWYHKETQPVVLYYRNLGILVEIDGEQSTEEVSKKIRSEIKGGSKS